LPSGAASGNAPFMQERRSFEFLRSLGFDLNAGAVSGAAGVGIRPPSGPELVSTNPATEETLGVVRSATLDDYDALVGKAQERLRE